MPLTPTQEDLPMSSPLFRSQRPVAASRWTRSARWTALLGACLLTSSCANQRPTVQTSPAPRTAVAQMANPAARAALDDAPEAVITTHRAQSPQLGLPTEDIHFQQRLRTSTVRSGFVSELGEPNSIQQTAYDEAVCPPPVSYQCEPREYVDTPGCPQDGMPCRSCQPSYAPTMGALPGPQMAAEPFYYGDEYICDGGDEGYPVHYHGPDMQGVETEDTVVEFHDNHGERRVQPSNKICIYAPRFASVRSATAPIAGVQIAKVAGAHDGQSVGGYNAQMRIDENRRVDQLETFRLRSRASGLGQEQTDNVFDATQSVAVHAKLINLYEARKFITDGQYVQGENAIITDGMAAAGVWSRDLNPVVSASDITGQQVNTVTKVEAYVGVEDPRGPGQLRVVKLADKSVAEIGDTVEFTIRIDNLGGLELTKVTLVDNLTPRLEYIDGSATNTIDGELLIEDNGEGSSKLTFRLSEPLKGKTGGVLKFQCLVR